MLLYTEYRRINTRKKHNNTQLRIIIHCSGKQNVFVQIQFSISKYLNNIKKKKLHHLLNI